MTTTLNMPTLGFPRVTRVVSEPPLPENGPDPITWVVNSTHPMVKELKILCMYIVNLGVEIYSVSIDGKHGVRNLIPMQRIRCVEEAMPVEVLVEEIEDAESGDDDGDDGGDEENDGGEEPAEPQNANGPATT